jgi:hypothetical protein
MKKEQIREEMARLDGWLDIHVTERGQHRGFYEGNLVGINPQGGLQKLPDYSNPAEQLRVYCRLSLIQKRKVVHLIMDEFGREAPLITATDAADALIDVLLICAQGRLARYIIEGVEDGE